MEKVWVRIGKMTENPYKTSSKGMFSLLSRLLAIEPVACGKLPFLWPTKYNMIGQ